MSDTQSLIYAIGIYVVFFVMIFIHYGSFAAIVLQWSRPPIKNKNHKLVQEPLTGSELIKCYIPLYQVIVVRKALYKSAGPFGVLSIISITGVVLNLINKFLLPINSYVMLVMNFVMIICTLLFIFVYGFVTADCARMYNFSFVIVLLNAIAPCVFCFWLKNNIPDTMRNVYKEETFSEHHGDTVIKQKHN